MFRILFGETPNTNQLVETWKLCITSDLFYTELETKKLQRSCRGDPSSVS